MLRDGTGDELLEQQEPGAARLALEAEHQRFVAEREQARGLQADDGNASLDERCKGGERARQLAPGFFDKAGGAAGRTR